MSVGDPAAKRQLPFGLEHFVIDDVVMRALEHLDMSSKVSVSCHLLELDTILEWSLHLVIFFRHMSRQSGLYREIIGATTYVITLLILVRCHCAHCFDVKSGVSLWLQRSFESTMERSAMVLKSSSNFT